MHTFDDTLPLYNGHLVLALVGDMPIIGIALVGPTDTPFGKKMLTTLWDLFRTESEVGFQKGPIGIIHTSSDILLDFGDFEHFTLSPAFTEWNAHIPAVWNQNILTQVRAFIFEVEQHHPTIISMVTGIPQLHTNDRIATLQKKAQHYSVTHRPISKKNHMQLSVAYEQYSLSIILGRETLVNHLAHHED